MATLTTSGPGTSLASSGADVFRARSEESSRCRVACSDGAGMRRKMYANAPSAVATGFLMISISNGYDFDRPQ